MSIPTDSHVPPRTILWGGTGQARVLRPIIEALGSKLVAVFDDTPHLPPPFPDVPLHEGQTGFRQWLGEQDRCDDVGFCIAIGNPHGRARLRLEDQLMQEGLTTMTVAHPSAIIAPDARIGSGCQFMAGAIINPGATLGRQCIINTGASVDHECRLADGVEIAPGATVCGDVRLDTNTWVGAGAIVLPRIHIGMDAIVGAGATVIRDVEAASTVVGVPAVSLPGKETA